MLGRIWLVISGLLCSGAVFAHELTWRMAGSDIGKATYNVAGDGTITAKSEFGIAGMNLSSTLSGKISDGKLGDYDLTLKQPGIDLAISAKNGKASITANGKKDTVVVKASRAFFGNLHPGSLASIISQYDKSKGVTQEIDTLMLDGAMALKVAVTLGTARNVGGKVVQAYKIRVGGTEIDTFTNENGDVVGMTVTAQRLAAVARGYEDLFIDPVLKYKELSQPTHKTKMRVNVRTWMRDGVTLAADIAMPSEEGKYPVILTRTPYGRASSMIDADWYTKRGYVYIAQDVRGRGDSAGAWKPFFNERADGYDTLAWIAKQPWSNGKVGMIGGSYVGWTQWWAAAEGHPALKCIIPQVSPPDPFYNMPWDHGIPFLFGAVWWGEIVAQKEMPTDILGKMDNVKKFLSLPITKVDDGVLKRNIPFVDDWWRRETNAAFTTARWWHDAHKITIPALHISGWWDGDNIGTKMNYAVMRKLGRTNQYLIYGPWTHFFNTTSKMGDVDYGADAIIDLNSVHLRWFDTWLKDMPVLVNMSKVKVFVTGANEWRELQDWPDPRGKETTLYFSSNGDANGYKGKGALVWSKPGGKPDRYTYDPSKLKLDMNEIDMDPEKSSVAIEPKTLTNDVLVYRTPPLKESIDMGGPIDIDLYFSTNVVDTDFFASVMEIDTKGAMRLIGLPGKLRVKYRNGMDSPALLTPGRTYKVTLAHWDTAHRFKKGTRIGVLVSSDMFPMYARNLNTGESVLTATRMVAAKQVIYHDAKRPSALRFHTVPR